MVVRTSTGTGSALILTYGVQRPHVLKERYSNIRSWNGCGFVRRHSSYLGAYQSIQDAILRNCIWATPKARSNGAIMSQKPLANRVARRHLEFHLAQADSHKLAYMVLVKTRAVLVTWGQSCGYGRASFSNAFRSQLKIAQESRCDSAEQP